MREFSQLAKRKTHNDKQADARTARICYVIAKTNSTKKNSKKIKFEDFMPKVKRKNNTWEKQLNHVKAINSLLQGKVVKKNEPR